MNRRRTLFTKFALATAGLALIWSAARAVGESLRDSQTAPQSKTESMRLPEVPTPRVISMSLPTPRLQRMPNAPPVSSREAPAKFTTLASGEQIAAILRGTALTTSAGIEPQRLGDAERSGPELATRSTKNKLK